MVFQITVIAFVPAPAVMAPPAETVQVYPVIPASVVYTLPLVPPQTVAGPVMVGTGRGVTVTVKQVGAVALQPLPFV